MEANEVINRIKNARQGLTGQTLEELSAANEQKFELKSETVKGETSISGAAGWTTGAKLGGIVLLTVLALLFLVRFFRKKKTKGQPPQNNIKENAKEEETDVSPEEPFGRTEKESVPKSGAGFCSVGKAHGIGSRGEQQDSFGLSDFTDEELYRTKGLFAAVADGMGGLANGNVVSQTVVQTCIEYFYGRASHQAAPDLLLDMTREVNARVNRMMQGEPARGGSTLAEVLIRQGKLYFLTVGDSRVYLFRGGKLICLNRPHVFGEELALEAVNGWRKADEVHSNPQKASLTSYIGAGELRYLDRVSEGIALAAGDKIMLATDGVFGTLRTEQMEQALADSVEGAAEQIEKMIQEAARPRQDNYTAVIIAFPEAAQKQDIGYGGKDDYDSANYKSRGPEPE